MDQITEQWHDGQLVLFLQGRLDHDHSSSLWKTIMDRLQVARPTELVCDLQGITSFDTVGIAFLRELEKCCAERTIGLTLRHVPQTAERLLSHEPKPADAEKQQLTALVPGPIARLGQWTIGKGSSFYSLIEFLGSFVTACLHLLRHPGRFRFRDFLFHFQQVGSAGVLLICSINALTGMVVVFQGESIAKTFGAPIYVANMVAGSIPGQMAPVLTAILIAGRSGTAFAAKIGTMKVRQELDVLAVMNFNISSFLVLPRVLAISLATPLLTILADAAGILGGLLTAAVFLNLSGMAFINAVYMTLDIADIYTGLIKGLVFGLIIGLTGCFHGLRTAHTADSVGLRTTAAVVSSIFIIIVMNTVFAALFNTFGW